jgi:PAS domain S-box-containing protein
MQSPTLTNQRNPVPEFLSGGGEMGERIRKYDWENTQLGPIQTWPQSLRTCIRIMLTSRQPIWIGWGKELIKLYNDPYRAIVGGKHPWALGTPASIVWKDIWREIGPMLQQVMEKDEGTYVESQLLIMERNGYPEETYYTFSYTPIPGDDGSTAGMICANTDDTDRIISERQLRTLTMLGKRLTDTKSNNEVVDLAITTLEENIHDFPFALFYSISADKAILKKSTDLDKCINVMPEEIQLNGTDELSILLNQAAITRKPQILEELQIKYGKMPKGAWETSPDKAIVLPITQNVSKEPYGFLVVGLNPYRLLDEKYRGFFSLVNDQIATSFANVHALEEERKRVEALAEIDRAKTIFFSNISHEFRTPLTLLMGPIEETINNPDTLPENKVRMEMAHRNALRMQKLVNTLLEFSRIEAGRIEGKFSYIDLCSFTQELTSTFRSAVEKAGMELIFTCSPIKEEVYVDVDMWEKIVLNLLSNAFKYTSKGKIEVDIKEEADKVLLTVSDTGVGIPETELEKIFERFHRIENMRGRSQEGTGIGLAMVKELVRLHKGSIKVSSQVGKGSTFTVSIPTGHQHLPQGKIYKENNPRLSNNTNAFVQEVRRWIPNEEDQPIVPLSEQKESIISGVSPKKETRFRVMLADDNMDMRDYVKRLLSEEFEVQTAKDGVDALQKIIHHQPDLLLSDIMMPGMNGFELLTKVRQHPDLKNIPVILLSARAGEEAKIEGLEAGADDYLVKPFSAKELIARVEANIKISKNRIASEKNIRNVILQSPAPTVLLKGPSMVIEIVNEKALEVWGRSHIDVINKELFKALPELIEQGFDQILAKVYTTGVPFHGNEFPVQLVRFGRTETVYLNFIYEPFRNEDHEVIGIIAVGVDVTEQVKARHALEQSQKKLQELATSLEKKVEEKTLDLSLKNEELRKSEERYHKMIEEVEDYAILLLSKEGIILNWNKGAEKIKGYKEQEIIGKSFKVFYLPNDQENGLPEILIEEAIKNGKALHEGWRVRKDGSTFWGNTVITALHGEDGTVIGLTKVTRDLTAKKLAENRLQQYAQELEFQNKELEQFAYAASHDMKEPLRKIIFYNTYVQQELTNQVPEKEKSYLSRSVSAAQRLQRLIDDLLNYSQTTIKNQDFRPVDLNKVLDDVVAAQKETFEENEVIIHKTKLPVINAIDFQMRQLFDNLLGNSIKYRNPERRLEIEISCEMIRGLQVENYTNKDYYRICINDNGIGFDQAQAERMFELFQRLKGGSQSSGTGIGLAICRKIVQNHKGYIEASGKTNQGATFCIYLPME